MNNYFRINPISMNMNYRNNINPIPMNMNSMSINKLAYIPINNMNNLIPLSMNYGNPIYMNSINQLYKNNMNHMNTIYPNGMNSMSINGINRGPMNYINSTNMISPFNKFKFNNYFSSFDNFLNNSLIHSPISSNFSNIPNPIHRTSLIEPIIPIQNESKLNKGLEQEIINKLPETIIKDVSKLTSEKKECVICLEEFMENENLTCLPCIHAFHSNCIKKWLKGSKECPICKFKITNETLNYQ